MVDNDARNAAAAGTGKKDLDPAGIAIEVTHRSKRRLFGLTGLARLRDVVRPPYRPEPGRGRGRPPLMAEDAIDLPALPSDPLTPIDRSPFDYSDLAHWMTQMDRTIVRRAASVRFRHGTANPASRVPEDGYSRSQSRRVCRAGPEGGAQ